MTNTVLSPPIPPFSNPPIEPGFFQPGVFFISAISLGQTTTITTTANNNYVIGQLCRLLIPNGYGSRQLNEQIGYVINIPLSNQVVLNINSSNSDSFINANLPTQAQIVAVGDINNGIVSSTGLIVSSTNVPGAFINISPL